MGVPWSLPTPVVGPQQAINQVNKAKGIVDASKQAQYTNTFQGTTVGGKFYPNLGNSDSATGIPIKTTPQPSKTQTIPTADDHMTADALGNQYLYNQSNGNLESVPKGSDTHGPVPPGSKVSNTVDVGGGIQYQQNSDGTYARYDANTDTYSKATAGDFSDAQQQRNIKTKADSILNGSYKLSPLEQTQIDGITSKYNDLISKTATENANITGAQTIAENMYGMGNTLGGKGEITKTVLDGLSRIQSLQDQLASSVSQMTMGFEKDDYGMLQSSYNEFVSTQDKISSEIDTQNNRLDSLAASQDAKTTAFALQQMNRYPDANIDVTDTPAQIQEKKQTQSGIYNQEVKTRAGVVDEDALSGMLDIYKKTGQLPTFGIGGANTKLAFYKALGGAPEDVDQATANKATLQGATKALSTQQNQYAGNQTSIQTLDKQLALVQQYGDKVTRTDSPFINKYLLWLKGQGAGDADTAALNNIVKTASTEFARILSGATASIASTPVSTQQDAENLINAKMSQGQLGEVINLMKQEAKFRITSQKGTIDQLQQDIHDLGNGTLQYQGTNTSSTQQTAPLTANTVW